MEGFGASNGPGKERKICSKGKVESPCLNRCILYTYSLVYFINRLACILAISLLPQWQYTRICTLMSNKADETLNAYIALNSYDNSIL